MSDADVQASAARSWVANGLLALASVGLTLGLLEVGLAVFYPISFSIERNMYFIADPFTGFRLRPNSSGVFGDGIAANTNSNGHRSDEVSPWKRANAFRVLVLGDSFTVGASVEQRETYASVLQRRLNGASSSRFEVINAGVGGWHPFQYAQYYQHYGPELDPDFVIVGLFVGNDILKIVESIDKLPTAVLGRRISRKAAADRLVRWKVRLHEHSHLARLVLNQRRPPFSYRRAGCDELPDFLVRIERGRREVHARNSQKLTLMVDRAVRQVARIHRLAAEAGVPTLVLLLPDENQINPALAAVVFNEPERYDLELPQSMLAERFAAAGIEVLDLLPVFRAHPSCLFQNDTHWTAEGHEIVADRIWQRIAGRVSR